MQVPYKIGSLIMQIDHCSHYRFVAQLVEQLTLNQRVRGSSPRKPTRMSSNKFGRCMPALFFILLIIVKLFRYDNALVDGPSFA